MFVTSFLATNQQRQHVGWLQKAISEGVPAYCQSRPIRAVKALTEPVRFSGEHLLCPCAFITVNSLYAVLVNFG